MHGPIRLVYFAIIFNILYTVKYSGEDDNSTNTSTVGPPNNFCPNDLQQFGNYCYFETDYTSFPYGCPYRSSTVYDSDPLSSLSSDYHWRNVKRNELYGYFEWFDIESHYGYLYDTMMPEDEDCVIRLGVYSQMTVKCEEFYKGFCVYTNNDFRFCDAYNRICNGSDDCACQSKIGGYLCETTCNRRNESICPECDRKFTEYPTPKLQIKSLNDSIVLVVENSLKLITLQYGWPFYCFSDVYVPSRSDIKYRYNKEEIVLGNNRNTTLSYTFKIRQLAVGRYWCEGFVFPDLEKVQSNTILAGLKSNYGTNFVLNVSLYVANYSFLYYDFHTLPITYLNIFVTPDKYQLIRAVRIFPLNDDQTIADVIFHLTTNPKERDAGATYEELVVVLKRLEDAFGIRNYSLACSDFCLPSITAEGSVNATWPETIVGQQTPPKEILLQANGLPIMRKCSGDFMNGAYWSEVMGKIDRTGQSDITDDLYDLVNSDKTAEELNEAMSEIITRAQNIIPYDVHLVARIFERVAQSRDAFNVHLFTKTLNLITQINAATLEEAQTELNATDTILYNFDRALGNITARHGGGVTTTTITSDNIVAQVTNLKTSDVRGIAVYKNADKGLQLKNITNATTRLEDLDYNNLKFATFITPKIFDQICHSVKGDPNLVTAMFLNDALFRDDNESTVSIVLSIFVTGLVSDSLEEPLPVIFKASGESPARTFCSHWKYGIDEMMMNIRGSWKTEDEAVLYEEMKVCQYSHMTHFAILAGAPLSDVLDYVSLVGCILSMIGIAGIYITAVAFKTWRNSKATKILLNFSTTILIEMVLLFVSKSPSIKNVTSCTIIALSLHYIVIAQFSWMFIIGYLQYRKFVLVLVHEPTHILLKSALIGWFAPIVPVLITFLLSSNDTYAQRNYCYLTSWSLYFGLFLPIGCIVLANMVLFVKILVSISCNKIQVFGHKKNLILLKINLGLVLFFLMGFSWIFGMLAQLFDSIALSYLFCITSTVQGLILYVYFVACNKTTRQLWAKKLHCNRGTVTQNVSIASKTSDKSNTG